MEHRFTKSLMAATFAPLAGCAQAGSLNIELDFEKLTITLANKIVQGGDEPTILEEPKKILDANKDIALIDTHPRWKFEMGTSTARKTSASTPTEPAIGTRIPPVTRAVRTTTVPYRTRI